MSTQTLRLPLLLAPAPDCARCAAQLETDLASLRGVSAAAVAATAGVLDVEYDPDLVTPARIEERARQTGAELAERLDHQTVELRDLDCPDCAASIEKSIRQAPGVVWAGANFAAARLHVEFERARTDLAALCRIVEAHGIGACPVGQPADGGAAPAATAERHPLAWVRENRRVASLAATAALMAAAWAAGAARSGGVPLAPALLAAAVVIGGWNTARSGWMALRSRSVDMNVLMTLAVIGAAALGDWFEAASVVALFNLGVVLQAGALDRTRRSIRGLVALAPKTARVLRGGSESDVPLEQIAVGDVVLVRPGERIAIDGEIIRGASTVDEAPITGESAPRDKSTGNTVYAGTLNGHGALEVRASRAYCDTTLARIILRVEEANAQRAPIQQTIDRFARLYTPFVVGLAGVVAVAPPLVVTIAGANGATAAIWGHWALRALALLIIACPCALVISTPVAIVTAIGTGARNGALIKGGAYLEELGRIRALLFDKTGTLTTGKFRIDRVVPVGGGPSSAARLTEIAAALESRSEHPLASAFACSTGSHCSCGSRPDVSEFVATPGQGVAGTVDGVRYTIGSLRMLEAAGLDVTAAHALAAEEEDAGRTVVALGNEDRVLALFGLSDTPREGLAETVAALRRLGVRRQGMVTGDNARVARTIAERAGLDDWSAALLPEGKLQAVRRYQREYGGVAMAGDGINDAPSLAASNVGIVLGAAASDTALETADVAITSGQLARLPWLIALSRRTHAIVRQNIAFSLLTKTALVGVAVTAGLPLWLAVAGDVGVSLLVTLNALRLRTA